jgi:hypothetical protein
MDPQSPLGDMRWTGVSAVTADAEDALKVSGPGELTDPLLVPVASDVACNGGSA